LEHDDPPVTTIPAVALASSERFGGATAVVDGDITLSFTGVRDGMLAVGASLIARGVQPGDRVALWAPNSAAWICSALGILATGAWLVPVNTRFKSREVAYVLEKVDARDLVVDDGFLSGHQLDGLRADAPSLRAVADPILLPGPGQRSRPEWDAFLGLGAPVGPGEVLDRIARLGADDVSDVIFTSGTTGFPKGVMLRHGASLRAYQAFNSSFGVTESDRVLIVLPFFHCFGYKAGWTVDLRTGATTFPVAVFDGPTVMAMIDRHRITHMPGSPTMFWPLLDHPRRSEFDLTSLRSVIIGGAFVPVELVRRLKRELGVETILNGYGLTENHAIVSISQPDDPPELVATTVGRVLDGLEVKVVDEAGDDAPLGTEGELLVRGYTHMSGYYGDPDATAAAFTDGWLHTGDVGTVDADRYVRITDRKKDIYITGGFNVAPAEVENALSACEQISQVAVVGVPDDRLGEVGAAFVVPGPGQHLTRDDVIAYARVQLANFKVPHVVEIVDALPVNATGKVLKDELRARVTKGRRLPAV
jgi:acyl-CoA synthetase (AMP-forming)/AMP-acid ligase II